ncbi:PLD nuclease N-terminal domain-containing protein [Xylanimonas protaetiae]|uniref:PLDc_N domain-containing protein n=1 Tax=Xylanimonas protaetiae TaxID=2509457 RepID=A0A4P6F276_9MICO|nr:PLD nuclease N-terminal domain-containing protein [Xylanimonas protaetiae]QAY69920.1 PLDc_N domain-containing protein [Xylanimonas protaetiae]
MPRVILTLAIIGLAVYALADLAGARKEETGGLPKWLWAVLIVVVPVIGGLAWIIFRRASGPAAAPQGGRGRQSSGPRREGPLAPDDDPEFLWRLKQQAERERRRREGRTGDPGDPTH